MRPRKKIWLRVSDRRLRGEWRFILEEVWMFRVVSSRPEEFHMVLTSRDLKGNHTEIREKIKAHFAKRGPKIGFKGLLERIRREKVGATSAALGNSLEQKASAA